uniref:Peptidase A1 domain-containing protein n=1 Tax=Schistocephalus solidus TaxID=70667 RepID=A0A0V0J7E1_SCHSO
MTFATRKKFVMNAFVTPLLVVTRETQIFNSAIQPSLNGIIGFAYSELAVQPPGNQPNMQSIMDNLVKHLELADQFTTKFCGSTEAVARSQGQLKGQPMSASNLLIKNITVTGTLTLGAEGPTREYQFQTVPVVEASHFRIVLTDISISGQSLIQNCKELNSGLTIVDTGTANIMLPSVVYRRFKEEVLAHFNQTASALSRSGSDLFRFGAKICQDIGGVDTPFPGDVYAAFPTVEFDILAQTGPDPRILRLSLSSQVRSNWHSFIWR